MVNSFDCKNGYEDNPISTLHFATLTMQTIQTLNANIELMRVPGLEMDS